MHFKKMVKYEKSEKCIVEDMEIIGAICRERDCGSANPRACGSGTCSTPASLKI
jgi:hypothetical protein